MKRREVLATICRLRQMRDRKARSSFSRGIRVGYHLAAHILWRDFRETQR